MSLCGGKQLKTKKNHHLVHVCNYSYALCEWLRSFCLICQSWNWGWLVSFCPWVTFFLWSCDFTGSFWRELLVQSTEAASFQHDDNLSSKICWALGDRFPSLAALESCKVMKTQSSDLLFQNLFLSAWFERSHIPAFLTSCSGLYSCVCRATLPNYTQNIYT